MNPTIETILNRRSTRSFLQKTLNDERTENHRK